MEVEDLRGVFKIIRFPPLYQNELYGEAGSAITGKMYPESIALY